MKTKTKWVTTREPNLLKNDASGRFYGRFNVSGKQKWVNLDTDRFPVAKLRLAKERVEIENSRLAIGNVASGTATMGEIARIYLAELKPKSSFKPATRTGYAGVLAMLRRLEHALHQSRRRCHRRRRFLKYLPKPGTPRRPVTLRRSQSLPVRRPRARTRHPTIPLLRRIALAVYAP